MRASTVVGAFVLFGSIAAAATAVLARETWHVVTVDCPDLRPDFVNSSEELLLDFEPDVGNVYIVSDRHAVTLTGPCKVEVRRGWGLK